VGQFSNVRGFRRFPWFPCRVNFQTRITLQPLSLYDVYFVERQPIIIPLEFT